MHVAIKARILWAFFPVAFSRIFLKKKKSGGHSAGRPTMGTAGQRAKRNFRKAEETEANPSRSFTTGSDVTIRQTDLSHPLSSSSSLTVLLFLTRCPPLPHPPHTFGIPPSWDSQSSPQLWHAAPDWFAFHLSVTASLFFFLLWLLISRIYFPLQTHTFCWILNFNIVLAHLYGGVFGSSGSLLFFSPSLSLSAAAYPEPSDQFLVTARHASNAKATRTRPVAGKRPRMEAS